MTEQQTEIAARAEPTQDAGSRAAAAGAASYQQLIWRKFRKHRLATFGGMVTLVLYLIAVFAEFIAPFAPDTYASTYTYAPPQPLHLIDQTDDGLRLRPYVNGYTVEIDYNAGRRTFVVDPEVKHPVGFLVAGDAYKLLGFINTNVHLVGPLNEGDPMYLLGADRLGRDMLSRTVYGTRISLSIGLIGVALSLFLGVLLGGISGYVGGATDNVIQRVIEFLQSIPSIPLWIGLAAAIPSDIPPLQAYFLITIILSVLGWTGLARVVRGKFYALKTEDFIEAARLDGCSGFRIIMHHMVPSFSSHIIAVVTLAIPGMILAETSLSFLGIGLRPPTVSWGVLLQEAQNIRAISTAPWLFTPGVAVVITVLMMNFLGDGLRDAADPYA